MNDKYRLEDRQTQKPDHAHGDLNFRGACPWCGKRICWFCDGEHLRVHEQHDNGHTEHSSWVRECGKTVCKDCIDDFLDALIGASNARSARFAAP